MKACLVGIVKNEEHGIFEWVLYHYFLGFDQIVVYENGSSDNTSCELKRAGRFAPLQVVDWPMRPGQIQAYNDAIERLRSSFDVFAMLDADEFLLPLHHDGLKPFLASVAEHPFVGLHWMMYGSGGHDRRPDGLVIENYIRRAQQPNRHIKSIVRPSLFPNSFSKFVNPHWMDNSHYVAANFQPLTWEARSNGAGGKADCVVGADVARINHYYTKSRDDYYVKMARANADSLSPRQDMFSKHDRNDTEDTTLLTRYPNIVRQLRDIAFTPSRRS